MTEHITIFKSGRLHEFELACNALNDAGIPLLKQEESSSGLKTSMYSPSMGPGTFWSLHVPISEKASAEKILSELPIELKDEQPLWHFSATSKSKVIWKFLIIIILFLGSLIFAFNTFNLFENMG